MRSRTPIKKFAAVSILILGCALFVGAVLLHRLWPFTEGSVRSQLAESVSANVKFGSFHEKYFPPGCVAENVTFQRNGSGAALITIRRLSVSSNLAGLLKHHVSLLRAEGLHVSLGKSDFSGTNSSRDTTVDKLVADDALLEIRQHGAQALEFRFHKFQIENLGGRGPTKFAAVFDNPMPAGLTRTSGQFGPWNSSDPASTAVSGTYSILNADLGVFHSIGGLISSDGSFKGNFKQMQVEGSTTTPDFELTATHHKIPLQTRFNAAVNATNGETILQRVRANFGRDEIDAHGIIGRAPDGRRAAVIDLNCNRGRIEDTFYPFIHAPKSPITGDVAFEMHVLIPSSRDRFLKKIELKSDFRIQAARFTNPRTEVSVSKVSDAGQKQPDDKPFTNFQGRVTLIKGIAHFPDLTLQEGDASAWFRGDYNLVNERVNMHGRLTTKASLSKATSGIKSVFAKVLEPIFKKGRNRKVVPVKISGTYHNPSFGLDMNSNM